MKYNSHPGKLLRNHLIEVRDNSKKQVPKKYRPAIEIAALCHDFGKYTTFFQGYLKSKKKSNLTNHGFISAVFGSYVGICRLGEDDLLPLIIYNIIMHHHGNLQNFSNNLPDSFRDISNKDLSIQLQEKVDAGTKQIDDMKNNISYIIEDMKILGLLTEFKSFLQKDNVIIDTLAKLRRLDVLSVRSLKDDRNYFIHQMLYSALISADKISASNIYVPEKLHVNFDLINRIREKKFAESPINSLNELRTDIYNTVLNTLEENYKKTSIFSITAPTGTGKTITGSFAALRLNQLLGGDRKIIYSLPFTSIIEQNHRELSNLFKGISDFEKNYSSYLMKHHSLASLEYENEYRNYSNLEAELLLENWNSGFVVTTFVQLLETLIGTRNRMLKKFNSIKGAIIILDEIQAIDIRYFQLVEYVLKKACEYLDVKIIIMTATKPLILDEAFELLPNNMKYFNLFKRTKIIPKINDVTIEQFAEDFIFSLEDKSYLIVCNTIQQSIELYNQLKDINRKVYYLSTNILPVHRQKRIGEIEGELKKNEKIILVSTQVVEAGVDLDFDVVIRDIGPIDSIIQCAGRCNRNNKLHVGEVYVCSMVSEEGNLYGRYVYGHTLINLSKEMLEDKEVIWESEYLDLINNYFRKVKEYKSGQVSEYLIDSIANLDFSEGEHSINTFSLIRNNPNYIDVLFIYNNKIEEVYNEFLNLSNIKEFKKRRELYLDIEKEMKNYTISVPIEYVRDFVIDRQMIVLPKEGIEQYYDDMTGFKRTEEGECMIF